MSVINQQPQVILDVRNHTPQSLTIELDGTALLKLAGGSSTRVTGIPTGRHTLVARSGEEVLLETTADIPSEGTFVWSVGDSESTRGGAPLLRVRNYAGQPVKLYVQGRHRIDIDPGDAATLTGIVEGPVALEALDDAGRVLTRSTLEMVGGLERLWTIEGPGGPAAVVTILNGTSSPLQVRIDGGTLVPLGVGQEVQFGAVAPGVHKLEAVDADTGRIVQQLEAELNADSSHEWTVTLEAAPGSG